MTTPDPTEYLRARYAEDEAAARAATPGPWKWEEAEDGHLQAGGDCVISAYGMHTEGWISAEDADKAHIARHDPARVLADVAAKRAVVEVHREESCPFGSGDLTGNCETCMPRQWESNPLQRCAEDHPCPTVRALLQEFADRDDFPDEWRTT